MTRSAPTWPPVPVRTGELVVMSTLLVPAPGAGALEEAFRNRMGAVDDWEGYHGLQVWRDLHVPGRFAMTSWWEDRASFARYMRSEDHAASHARVPRGEYAPSLETLHRYEVVGL